MTYQVDVTTNDEIYAIRDGKQVYESDRYAIKASGEEYYALNSDLVPYYRKNADNKEVYAIDSNGDEFYRFNINGDQVYAIDENGSQYYAITVVNGQSCAQTRDRESYYATDAGGNEMYPKNRRHDEYYVLDLQGNVIYAKHLGVERYARDAHGREQYSVFFDRYARDRSGDEFYIAHSGMNAQIKNHLYAVSRNGTQIYPSDQFGNRFCMTDAKGEFSFAKTADGKFYYPYNHEGYILIPRKGDVEVRHADDDLPKGVVLRKFRNQHFLTDVLSPQCTTNVPGHLPNWKWFVIRIQALLLFLLVICWYF